MPLLLGADIGGTKIGMVLLGADGEVLDAHQHPTEADSGSDAVLQRIESCARTCFAERLPHIAALGVGVAGQVDAQTGAVLFAPNLGWTDVPVGERLRAALGLPVVVTNDVRAATCGEWAAGAGMGVDDIVVVFVGTGIGGGVVSGGRLLTGGSNTFGELGHVPVVVGGRRCRCGGTGCVEAYASGWAIAERARELVYGDPERGAALRRLAGVPERITARTVTAAYREGDAAAGELVDDVALHLGTAATGFVNALNPSRLILGGGVVAGLPELVEAVDRVVRANALDAATARLRVVRAALGSTGPAIGAAALARAALAARDE
ncbi:MAG TPA: ROK family protein [Gemmatimonadaceae bacterium]|nr:ROK family protein [Gemmatimonadaceae bacterium]